MGKETGVREKRGAEDTKGTEERVEEIWAGEMWEGLGRRVEEAGKGVELKEEKTRRWGTRAVETRGEGTREGQARGEEAMAAGVAAAAGSQLQAAQQ